MNPSTKQTPRAAKYLMYTGLAFLAVPVFILGSTLFQIDQSGLSTIGYLVILGLPSAFLGVVLLVSSVIANITQK